MEGEDCDVKRRKGSEKRKRVEERRRRTGEGKNKREHSVTGQAACVYV